MNKNNYRHPVTEMVNLGGERLMDPLQPTGFVEPVDPNKPGGSGFGAPGRGLRL